MTETPPFWERKSLSQMSREEWESLCDGCGRCCLVLLCDDDEPEFMQETSLHCRLFDAKNRRCTCYAKRTELVPECVELRPDNVRDLTFMPGTCAYRLLSEGKPLPDWHPLVSGERESVVRAGIAVSPDLTDERLVREEDLWRYCTGSR